MVKVKSVWQMKRFVRHKSLFNWQLKTENY